ncbi:hypothetical protein HDU97_004359 [Phlyctochytrium planicorne]|nr:hypothetical protein HDU97_004359 [Phlyctochytrium planicorne]
MVAINFSALFAAVLAIPAVVMAAPAPAESKQTSNRNNNDNGLNVDLTVVQFALLLEDLESAFYQQGLARFDRNEFRRAGFRDFVRDEFTKIAANEATHVGFLGGALNTFSGGKIQRLDCGFDFSVAFRDVRTFVSFASVLERTGVSAYTGANFLLSNPDIKTAAATIATTEGRHAAFLNLLTGVDPTTGPFDTPLSVPAIVSIAAPFLRCGRNVQLPAQPFQPLQVIARDDTVVLNGNVMLFFDALSGNKLGYNRIDFDTRYQRMGNDRRSGRDVGFGNFDGLKCGWVFGLNQVRTELVFSNAFNRRLGREVFVPTCLVPDALKDFTQAVLFVVKDDKDVSLSDASNVVAGPATLNIVIENRRS